jgi:hypothetical protein
MLYALIATLNIQKPRQFYVRSEQTTSAPSDNVAMINYVKMTGRDALHTDENTTESRVPTRFRLVTLTGEASNW